MLRKWQGLMPLVATHFCTSADVLELRSCNPLKAEMRLVGLDTLDVTIYAQVMRESPIELGYTVHVQWRSRYGVKRWRLDNPERTISKLIEAQYFDALEKLAPVELENRQLKVKRKARWLRKGIRLYFACTTSAAAPIWYRLEVTLPLSDEMFANLANRFCEVAVLLDNRVELDRAVYGGVTTSWRCISNGLQTAEQVGE